MRTFSVLIVFCSVLALAPAGCGGKKESKKGGSAHAPPHDDVAAGADRAKGDDRAAPWEGKSDKADKADRSDKAAEPPKSREAAAEAMVVKGRPSQPKQPPPQTDAGLLTAGSFDDNLDPAPFRNFLRKMGQDSAVGPLPGKFAGRRLTVVVKNDRGQPVGGARVRVAPASGGAAVELLSRSDGRAVFVHGFDGLPSDDELRVTVTPAAGKPVEQTAAADATRCEVTLPGAAAPLPLHLDLALVIDTTGSMGDELDYLKAEFRNIVTALGKQFPNVSQRYGLVLYRDRGDEYEVRPLPFTDNLDTFRTNLGKQRAGGGGDYPEAMHRGLEEAAALEWRPGNAARVVFLIADAPPHAEHAGRTVDAVNALRKKGVAVYPVACSGADAACEFVMRSAAVLTGGQYVFLTDDSGVGGKHAEPHIPNYHVERLNQLMVRLIAGELSGRRISPDPSQIVRTVGNPVSGQ